MKVNFTENLNKGDTLVIAVADSLRFGAEGRKIDKKSDGVLTRAMKLKKFKADKGDVIAVLAPQGIDYSNILILGLGAEKDIDDKAAQNIGGKLYSKLNAEKSKDTVVLVEEIKKSKSVAANIAHGAVLKSYNFDKYRTTEESSKKPSMKKLTVSVKGKDGAEGYFKEMQAVAEGVFLARDVITEPSNVIYPKSYADTIKKQFAKTGATVKVLGQKQMEKLGMGSLLGVGQGSVHESQLVVIEWRGNKTDKNTPIAFVGKGVTFDTGGISLKPSLNMDEMKYDMGGSAVVVGLMKSLVVRKAKVNVVGIVGLVENMPGGAAQRPGDVVTSMSGQTIEVLNTDAEGRLVLADALWYAQKTYKPKQVIDLATLTGAIVIALGNEHAGMFSNSDSMCKKLTAAGDSTGEKLWRLPLGEEYDKMIDSPIADMQNISSGRGAGSITAAQFLQRFIQEGVEWVHLDIAGVTWAKKDLDICPKGATAFGVRLLNKFVQDNLEG